MNNTILLTLALLASVLAQQGLVALSGNNLIYTFSSVTASTPTTTNTFTGLNDGETLLSIATYPTNIGEYIYGLTTSNRFVYLNTTTNTVTPINTLNGCAPATSSNPTLNIDFDPATGNLYILTLVINTTNFYVVNPFTGSCTPLPATNLPGGGAPVPAGLAFVFQNARSPFTTESLQNNLDSVNTTFSTLTPVGSLGSTSLSGVGGFVYSYVNNNAVATLYNITSKVSDIYTVNLATGAATRTGDLAVSVNLLGLTARNGGSFPSGVIGGRPPGFPDAAVSTSSNTAAFTTTVGNTAAYTTTVGNTAAFTTTLGNTAAYTTTVGNTAAYTTTVTTRGSTGATVVASVALVVAAMALVF